MVCFIISSIFHLYFFEINKIIDENIKNLIVLLTLTFDFSLYGIFEVYENNGLFFKIFLIIIIFK